jgi:dephospho-CoA kinase
MGKSTSANLLRQRDFPVVDTDELARQIVEAGQPALEAIREVFGAEMIDAGGRLRRDQLARRVFTDASARAKLEAITHPCIRELWKAQVAAWREEGRELAVVIIPLLFETGAETEFQTILCLACTHTTQHQRLLARGWTVEEIEQRNAAQWPVEQKMARAHHVIWTEGDLEVHEEQLSRLLPRQ